MCAYHIVLVLIFQPLALYTLLTPENTETIFPCPKVTGISSSLQPGIAGSVNERQVTFHQCCNKPLLTRSHGVFEMVQSLWMM